MAKKTFFAVEPLLHDGKTFSPGDKVVLDEQFAAALLSDGAVSQFDPQSERSEPDSEP